VVKLGNRNEVGLAMRTTELRIARPPRLIQALALLLLPALGACTVTLMSAYDDQTEKMTTELQSEISAYHQELVYGYGSPSCLYSNNVGFFKKTRSEIDNLRVRVSAIGKNEQTKGQVDQLLGAIDSLEALQKLREQQHSGNDRCYTADQMADNFSGIEIILGAIMKLEMAKKR
jgi:hypothetical protein